MTISVGDTIPGGTVLQLTVDGPVPVDMAAKLKARNVVLFGLPGAYTGVCSTAHVPSFIRAMDAFRAKGVDEVICVSVNDPFVMNAWAKDTGAEDAGITMLGDADASFTKALGLDFSAPPAGLIDRAKRYALYAENGVVKALEVEENPGECSISSGVSFVEKL